MGPKGSQKSQNELKLTPKSTQNDPTLDIFGGKCSSVSHFHAEASEAKRSEAALIQIPLLAFTGSCSPLLVLDLAGFLLPLACSCFCHAITFPLLTLVCFSLLLLALNVKLIPYTLLRVQV